MDFGKKGHFRSKCEAKTCDECGRTYHGAAVCPSGKQVAKQRAVLALQNADVEHDEAVTTSAFLADQTTSESERVGEIESRLGMTLRRATVGQPLTLHFYQQV